MKIALDISPLKTGNFLQHRVRGTGFYTKNLMESLQRYHPDNQYTFLTRDEKLLIPIDVMHIPYFEPFFLTLPFKKIVKTVVTVHDLTPLVFPQQFPSGIKGKLKWQIQKNSLKHVDAIITDSESSKKDIIKFTNIHENNIHVAYLAAGNNFKKMQLDEKQRQSIQEKYMLPRKFALYVGDITWNKNLPRLVQAIKKTDIPLVLVGKALVEKKFDTANPWNQDRIQVQNLIEEYNQKNKQLYCLGFVPDEDLVVLYTMATVFTMPSLYEGFGLPILEAMNCGCPVVTTKEGSLLEVAGESAYYVDGYSVESIAKGIQTVFTEIKLQQTLSEKGLLHAKKFSWEKTANETVQVYQQLLDKNNL